MKALILLSSLMFWIVARADTAVKILNPATVLSTVKSTGERCRTVTDVPSKRLFDPISNSSEVKVSLSCDLIERPDPARNALTIFANSGLFKKKKPPEVGVKVEHRTIEFFTPKVPDPKMANVKIRRRTGTDGSDLVVKFRPADPTQFTEELAKYQVDTKTDKKLLKCEEDWTEQTKVMSCSLLVRPARDLSSEQIALIKKISGADIQSPNLGGYSNAITIPGENEPQDLNKQMVQKSLDVTQASDDANSAWVQSDRAVSWEFETVKQAMRADHKDLPNFDFEVWVDPGTGACKSVMLSAKTTPENANDVDQKLNALIKEFGLPKSDLQGFKAQ